MKSEIIKENISPRNHQSGTGDGHATNGSSQTSVEASTSTTTTSTRNGEGSTQQVERIDHVTETTDDQHGNHVVVSSTHV